LGCNKASLEPSVLQAEQSQFSQPFFTGEVFYTSDHFCGPPLGWLYEVIVLFELETPELDALPQVESQKSRPEEDNHTLTPFDWLATLLFIWYNWLSGLQLHIANS